jgi:hypothetical protein
MPDDNAPLGSRNAVEMFLLAARKLRVDWLIGVVWIVYADSALPTRQGRIANCLAGEESLRPGRTRLTANYDRFLNDNRVLGVVAEAHPACENGIRIGQGDEHPQQGNESEVSQGQEHGTIPLAHSILPL